MNRVEVFDMLGISPPSIIGTIEGGNSDVYKYQDLSGNLRALKIYKGSSTRVNQMFHRETAAIEFLNRHQFLNIPQDLQASSHLKVISYRWIDGNNPVADEHAMNSIFKMIIKLLELSTTNTPFKNAIDAAFSPMDIVAQMQVRMRNLGTGFDFEIKNITDRLTKYIHGYHLDFMYQYKTLSLSDLGIHNMIRQLQDDFFIDFEFFGYDSIAKMLGDFFLHPRNTFSSQDIARRQSEISELNSELRNEILLSLPLLALKWSLIALGRAGRMVDNDSMSIFKRIELQSRGETYIKYFDYLISKKIDEPSITFSEFELDQIK